MLSKFNSMENEEMSEIENLEKDLRKLIGEERYNHSIGVMNAAKKLANIYGVDENRAMKAGLMHDMAKEFSKDKSLEYIKANKIETDLYEDKIIFTLHGKIAADICKKEYNFDDEMCNAIRFHTTSTPNMTLLEKIIYVADKIDVTRNYKDVDYYRHLAEKDINQTIIELLNYNICDCINKGKIVLSRALDSRNYLILEKNLK